MTELDCEICKERRVSLYIELLRHFQYLMDRGRTE